MEAAAGSIRGHENATVLIVEDSPVQAELLRRALEGAGYKVIAAGNGAEGLAMAQGHHPVAVVSDINMPVMDGYALCHAIRQDDGLKSTPVILLTMLSDPQDVIGGLNAGADAYVTKPYNVPSLVSRIELLVSYPPPPPPPVERRKLEVHLGGETHLVDAHGPRMLNLLVSSYENAVLQNRELVATQQALEELNQHLEQKVVEKTAALRESEERFRSISTSAQDAIIVMDDAGRITFWNAAAEKMFGYSGKDVLGQELHPLLGPARYQDDYRKGFEHFRSTGEGPVVGKTIELTAMRSGGEEFPVELSLSTAQLVNKRHAFGIIRDISERKRAEQKIAKLNRLYATLSGINMAIVHAASPAELFDRVCEVAVEQGKFAMAWIGTVDGPDPMIAPVARRGLSQDDMAAVRRSIGPIAESPSHAATAIREKRIVYTNDHGAEALTATWRAVVTEWSIRGSAALPITQFGKVVGMLALYVKEQNFFDPQQLALLEEMRTDISFAMDRFDSEAQKTRAETALRDSEVRYRSLAENLCTLIYRADPKTLSPTYVNPAVEQIYGHSAEEWVKNPELRERTIHPGDRERVLRVFADAQAKLENGATEYRILRHDGATRWVSDSYSWEKDSAGQVAALDGVMSDITERKRVEEELRRLNWALRALGQSNSALVHAGTEKELFQACCEAIADTHGYPLAWIGLAIDDTANSIAVAAAAGEAVAYMHAIEISWADTPHGGGPTGMAIRSGATQVTDDLAQSEGYLPWRDAALAHGLASSIALPIRASGKIMGALVVYGREPNAFAPPEIQLFEELALDIGYGIASRRTLA
ncbi:MAG: PAS domain S-box protein, partial [Pseudomonadota bacterium]